MSSLPQPITGKYLLMVQSIKARKEKSQSGMLIEKFPLTTPVITIGRGLENSLSLIHDLRCSRRHAIIRFEGDEISLENVSDGNLVWVNSKPCKKIRLQVRDVIRLGDTELRLQLTSPVSAPVLAPVNPAVNSPASAPSRSRWTSPTDSVAPMKTGSNKTIFRTIVGVLLFFGGWYLFKSPKTDRSVPPIVTDDMTELETISSKKRQVELLEELKKSGKSSAEYYEAQSYFVRGFRDYQQEQYGRAINGFSSALAIFPQHVLAEKYLNLARRKRDEVIQQNMVSGRKNRDRGRYDLCQASFKAVMDIIRDSNNNVFKEADQLYEECRLLNQGKY